MAKASISYHLDLVMTVQIITATCVLHIYCLLHDEFDDGYFLPGHADGGGDDGSEQQGPPDDGAAQKMVHLMNIVTTH